MKFEKDIVVIVETNVDDVTGEVLAFVIDRLLNEGAYDATASTYIGKKGRLGYTIRVVCSKRTAQKIAKILVEETGTLGVKMTEYTRLIVPRKVRKFPVSIEGFRGKATVKVAKHARKILRIKPEISEAKKIAESHNIPLREVIERIVTSAENQLKGQTTRKPSR